MHYVGVGHSGEVTGEAALSGTAHLACVAFKSMRCGQHLVGLPKQLAVPASVDSAVQVWLLVLTRPPWSVWAVREASSFGSALSQQAEMVVLAAQATCSTRCSTWQWSSNRWFGVCSDLAVMRAVSWRQHCVCVWVC